jgi:hypothetical protein
LIPIDQKTYLTRDEAAQWLRENYGTGSSARLACLATAGTGPAYRLNGNRAVYEIADLKAWTESRLSKKIHSTSELKRGAA